MPIKNARALYITEQMEDVGTGMSNFEHTIEEGLAEKLQSRPGEIFSRYAGWNFNGRVWFADGEFHCEVWTYHVPREIISADSLEKIMESVSNEYGWD